MNILLHTLSDPIWQVLAVVITLVTLLLVVAVRTRDVHISVQQRKQETLRVLGVCLAALQKERIQPPPASVRLTIVHCRLDQVSDTSATGFLLLQTVGPYGYTDGYERPFQLTLKVEDGAWKIAQIARCLSDGCLDATTSVVP